MTYIVSIKKTISLKIYLALLFTEEHNVYENIY